MKNQKNFNSEDTLKFVENYLKKSKEEFLNLNDRDLIPYGVGAISKLIYLCRDLGIFDEETFMSELLKLTVVSKLRFEELSQNNEEDECEEYA